MSKGSRNSVSVWLLALGTGCTLDTAGLGASTGTSTSSGSTGPVATSAPSTGPADSTGTGSTSAAQGSGSTSVAPASSSSGEPGSSSEGSTGESGLVVAGELIVDLDAAHPSAGQITWTNEGSGSDFVRHGMPERVMVDDHVGIEFFAMGPPTVYESQQDAPASVVGPDPTRTIEVWAWNHDLNSEESMVAWSRRGGPSGSSMSFNFGNDADFGAVVHWDEADLGWLTAPTSNEWHHLVYTYDGTTTRVYIDGVLDNSEVLGPGMIDTHPEYPFVLGAQTGSSGDYERRSSLVLAKVRVHRDALDDAGVAHNDALEQGEFQSP